MTSKNKKMLSVASHLAANIENLSDQSWSSTFYIPTKQSIEFVNLLADSSLLGGSALSLQGAYGAGKSSLGIFTMHQLAKKSRSFSPKKRAKFGKLLSPSVNNIQKLGGMFTIPVLGSASPLAQRISVGLRNAAANYVGRRPKVLLDFVKLDSHLVTNEQILRVFEDLQMELPCPAGIMLMIDEFGRQFEHMIATGELDDLHLLQNLAELPGKNKIPFSLVVIQHQGLEHYTNRFMAKQHTEWEKVSGRFKEFLLNNSETETANIISALIERSKNKSVKARRNTSKMAIGPLNKEFIFVSRKCYPLHPMTVYLLARLSRLLGQGDRTVVGWLTSHLNTGFIEASEKATGWLYPSTLFLHFFGNIQNMPMNPAIAKRFNAVHSACSRHDAGEHELSTRLLQTIGLLYFCQGSGLKGDLKTIKYSMPKSSNLESTINELVKKSLIVFRRHSKEYKVWEGSDYDIQTRLNEVIQTTSFPPAESLGTFPPKRILAHKHFIETGNHRTSDLIWVNKQQVVPCPDLNHEPRIYIWLDKAPPANKIHVRNSVWGVMNTKGISDLLQEASALQHMLENDLALQHDIVASGEIKDQLSFLASSIEKRIHSTINSQMKWSLGPLTFNNLQHATSAMIDRIYKKSYTLHNEMINREKTSGQATLAVRLLIEAMVQRNSMPCFDIKKFPAERLLYESMFRETGIHRKSSEGEWYLSLDANSVDSKIAGVFKHISQLSEKNSSDAPCDINTILNKLGKPPYGIKQLPALILCCIYIYDNKDHVELYEDGSFQPIWRDQTLVRLVRSPGSFGIKIPESVKYSDRLLGNYRKALNPSARVNDKNTPLNIAKDILIRYSSLSSYAKHTSSVSSEAMVLRQAILSANSPNDLLFSAFPKIFGLRVFPKQANKRLKLFRQLAGTLAELENADNDLLSDFGKILLKECACRKLSSARKQLTAYASKIILESRMHHPNESFLKSIRNTAISDEKSWLRNLLDNGLKILKPFEVWNDEDVAKAEFELRTRLIWLRQAAETLDLLGSGNGSKIAIAVTASRKPNSRKKEEINKMLETFSTEQIVSLLLDFLNLQVDRKS